MRGGTTLRELVAEIGGVTFEYASSTEEAYEIACVVLLRILKNESRDDASVARRFATTKYSSH